MDDVRERLRAALRTAMKERDRATIPVLRSTLAAIENAEAVEHDGRAVVEDAARAGAGGGLGAGEAERGEVGEQAVLAREIEERRTSAAEYERLGRAEEAARLRAEADLLTSFA